jgi:deazaflavin-dependent oxidoreductase (nitroreductase family)
MGPGRDCLLLTTKGRKSGEPRSTALLYLEDGDRLVVVASNLGSDHAPAWWLNLEANPDAEVAIGTEERRVRAREANEEERAALWPRLVEYYGGYDAYREDTDRHIPVVVLEPAGA